MYLLLVLWNWSNLSGYIVEASWVDDLGLFFLTKDLVDASDWVGAFDLHEGET